jgi:ABC-2 type transport system ATP-binding protein
MLLGLVLPTRGEVELLGERMPRAARRVLPRVGALIEAPAHHGHLSGPANLTLLDAAGPGGARRTRRRRVAEVLDQVGLAGVGRRPVKAFSLGMRQRLGLAGALLRRPELLVLDEPTNGLDPQGITEIRGLLLELNRGGTTVFLSSHLLAEVEQLCTRVGVLDRGRMVLQDDLATLTAPTGATVVDTPEPERARAVLDGRVLSIDGARVLVRGGDPAEVNARLVAAGVPVRGLAVDRPSLEQVVLAAASVSADRVDAGERGGAR